MLNITLKIKNAYFHIFTKRLSVVFKMHLCEQPIQMDPYSLWPLIAFINFACQGPCSSVPLLGPLYEEN